MQPPPPRPGATPEKPDPRSLLTYLPGGLPVLRAAVEELLRSSWDEPYRQRAIEISCAFEGSFRYAGQADLAALVHTLTLLLEIKPEEVVFLGSALTDKIVEVLNLLETKLKADEGLKTG